MDGSTIAIIARSSGFVPLHKTTTYRRAENNVIPMRTLDTTKLQTQHYDFLKTRGISAAHCG